MLLPIDRAIAWVPRGRWTLSAAAAPTLLLTCTGRRSGQPRTTPLVYVPADGGWAVVGTDFGKPDHPGWVHNLTADPNGTIPAL